MYVYCKFVLHWDRDGEEIELPNLSSATEIMNVMWKWSEMLGINDIFVLLGHYAPV